MIKTIDIASQGVELTEDLKKYINKKIGKLDRYTPRHARKSVHAAVKLREKNTKSASNKYECEAILYLPNEQLTANEATLNMFAAVDIVETKLQSQLRRYKERAIKQGRIPRRQITNRLRRILRRETPETGSE